MFARANQNGLRKKGMRRSLLRMLAIILASMEVLGSSAFVTSVYGATVTEGTVKVNSGNVRKDASTTSSVVFCVGKNESVAILSEEKGKDGMNWYKISVGNSVGYIRSDLVSKTDKKIVVNDSLVQTKAQDDLVLVETPQNPTSDKRDTDVEASSKKNDTETGDKIANEKDAGLKDGKTGIVNADYVRMRNGASTSSGIVCYLDKGGVVSIVGEGKAADGQIWYQIRAKDTIGFVRSDLINKLVNDDSSQDDSKKKDEDSKEKNDDSKEKNDDSKDDDKIPEDADKEKTEEEILLEDEKNIIPGECVVKVKEEFIRKAPNLDAEIIARANEKDSFAVYGASKGSDFIWYKIKVKSGDKEIAGYICAESTVLTRGVETKKDGDSKDEDSKDEKDTKDDDLIPSTEDNYASIKGVGVRVRQLPVDGNIVCQLSSGHPLVVIDSAKAADGFKWYQVSFSYLGSPKKGYVREDFVLKNEREEDKAPKGDEEFEKSISAFPKDYKNALRSLHEKHPKWVFEAVNTGLEWNDALTAESSVGKNLVSKNSVASWKSTAAQAYNWASNTWYTFDGGSWVSASPELIAYYMDPRNFLNDSGIYQFENLDFSENQNAESVSKMLIGTFMSGNLKDVDGTEAAYADLFMLAGQTLGVSPYLLAGRCLQEQGIKGESQSISGTVKGHAGIFNYYNVGAYAYGGRSATINGLIYAAGEDAANARPWNSRVKSIYGGAKYIADQYVSRGQNTLYFQKFNVVNSENTIYSHQYMSNIQAASSESARLQLAYLGGDEELHFRIPVYNNMPSEKCEKPVSDSSPNTYLATLEVSGAQLMPAFTGATENYLVNVDASVETVTINATAVSATSSVGGVGTYPVNNGSNVFYIVCKAQSGASKTYKITVQK